MENVYYIGLDIHKKMIAWCLKDHTGRFVKQGEVKATRLSLQEWVADLPQPWVAAMEATLFTGWVYDFLSPFAQDLKVAHPEMLKAITAAKKKNDQADAERIADLLRVGLLPECYMAPREIRELRRVLRFRNLLVRQAVRMKNKISGLLMEVGAPYSKSRLHGQTYFHDLLGRLDETPDFVLDMLKMSRMSLESFTKMQKSLLSLLRHNGSIRERVERLMTIPGVGEVLALTWVLEVGDPWRFPSTSQAVSYCGLTSAQKESAGKNQRGPISKKRNKHLQTMLVEASKLAPRWNSQLARVHEREKEKGNRNRATLAVARKLAAYMLAVDKSQKDFIMKNIQAAA